MTNLGVIENTKNHVSFIINSLIEMISNPNLPVTTNAYYYHPKERHLFIIYLYCYKLLINNDDYIEKKYKAYIKKYKKNKNAFSLKRITNIECSDALNLLLIIKQKVSKNEITYDESSCYIQFNDDTFVDAKWFLTFISLILDNSKEEETKEINICYCIASTDIEKCSSSQEKDNFLSKIRFYSITIKRTDKTKFIKENNILIVKNAAINYLKHLKNYQHGLESRESYQIFYNLLKNECRKDSFKLIENDSNLLDIDEKLLKIINSSIDNSFYEYDLNKQIKHVEDIVWQSSNDITLLEHTNSSIDSLVDLLTSLRLCKNKNYSTIRNDNKINDIQVLLVLVTNEFLLTYLNNTEKIDYSLLNLSNIKPKYMNNICHETKEEDIQSRIKSLNLELAIAKKNLDTYKQERADINSEHLSKDKFQKTLELRVSKINSISITIARLNSNLSSLTKEYDSIKQSQKDKYYDIEKYNYNHSIIKHITNSILGCSFYLKTSNSRSIISNIVIFEDYEKNDNSFYLEISFKDLLKISNKYTLNSVIEQNDLPKLA